MAKAGMSMATEREQKTFAREVVRETLLAMGIDITDPEELVKIQADRHFVRSSRLRAESIGNNSLQHIIYVVMSGITAAAALGLAKMLGFMP